MAVGMLTQHTDPAAIVDLNCAVAHTRYCTVYVSTLRYHLYRNSTEIDRCDSTQQYVRSMNHVLYYSTVYLRRSKDLKDSTYYEVRASERSQDPKDHTPERSQRSQDPRQPINIFAIQKDIVLLRNT